MVLSIVSGRGPGNELSGWKALLSQLQGRYRFKYLLADAGYDCEAVHEFINKTLKAKSLIPPTKIRRGVKARKPYRKLMEQIFKTDPKLYKSRWQVETVVSMIKRNLSSALKARTLESQSRELSLLALTHNLSIVAAIAALLCLFYRAHREK